MNDNRKKDGKTGKSSGGAKKPNNKNRSFNRKESKFDKEACGGKTRASNDPKWYGAESMIMRDAATLPFGNAAGMPLDVNDPHQGILLGDSGNPDWAGKVTIPGIMTLEVLTLPGRIGDWSDPFNIAIRDKYSYIRHANSGHPNYDASDLGMYFLAYDACATFYAYICRLYGLLRTSNPRNRYMPADLVTALGANYSDLIKNMAQFRAYINSFPARLTLKVPSDLTFIERHMWLFSNVFADAPTAKAQIYALKPAGLWKHTITDNTHFMEVGWEPGNLDYAQIVEIGETLLNDILNSEDFNIMSGDIIKAYGDKLYNLNMITEDFTIAPVFDPEFLLQFHNATVCEADITKWQIHEQMNENEMEYVGALTDNRSFQLRTDGTLAFNNVYPTLAKFLDMPIDAPSPKEVAIATRFMVGATCYNEVVDKVEKSFIRLSEYGSEVVLKALVWTHDFENGQPTYEFIDSFNSVPIECFGSHPIMMAYETDGAGKDSPFSDSIITGRIVGDVDNLTTVRNDTLYNIHRAAILAMFGLV